MAKEIDVIGQQFARETTSDVTKEMIRAGSMGKSRIAAGVKAAWHAKTGSMYGRDTTKMARFLRLMGQQNTAKWYDRFFATEKMKAQRASRSTGGEGGEGGTSDARVLTQVKLNTGLLKAQGKRLDTVHGLLGVVASDVLDIKTIIAPSKNKTGGLANQNNPHAQSKVVAMESAKIVLKVIEEEKSRAELRRKFSYKEEKEEYDKDTDTEKLGEKIDHLGLALDEMKKMRGGILSGLLGSLLKSFLVRAALVGMAAYVGLKVGQWLSDTFNISQRLNDFFDDVRDKLGIKKKYDPNADNVSNEEYMRRNNEKLAGTAWKQVGAGLYEKDGQRFKESELTEETKLLFKERGMFDQSKYAQAYPQTAKPVDSKLSQAEYNLAQAIAKGEGTTEEQARSRGYNSGYDVPVYYGKYGQPPKPISEMNFSELRSYQNATLKKQYDSGVESGKGSSAVGKYQFTRTTLFGEKDNPGLLETQGIKLTERFSPTMQDRLFKVLLDQAGMSKLDGSMDKNAEFQGKLAGRWASVADPTTNEGRYEGQTATVKNEHIQPIIADLRNKGEVTPATTATPVNGSLAKNLDQESKALQSFNNTPAPITVVAPQQQTVVNNMPNPTPPKPVQKGHALSNDPSFIRAANRNVVHPTETN